MCPHSFRVVANEVCLEVLVEDSDKVPALSQHLPSMASASNSVTHLLRIVGLVIIPMIADTQTYILYIHTNIYTYMNIRTCMYLPQVLKG